MDSEIISLATFVREAREKIGLSLVLLAKRSNLTEEQVADIEAGKELFLSSTIRQKLAKGLKITPAEIQLHEKNVEINYRVPKEFEDFARVKMLAGETDDLRCPICGSELNIRVVKRYDLEDNLVLHYKASCKKCPFQIV
jgi:transcriptional regulator with XRE-family HTH domain